MRHTLTLSNPIALRFAPGVEREITDLQVMELRSHREPEFDAGGELVGWKAGGSYVDVLLVGDHGHVEAVRIHDGDEALAIIDATGAADLTTRPLPRRILERVEAHVDEDGNQPYAGTIS